MRQQIELTHARRLALAALVTMTATSMGCRSRMPRMNMFGFGKSEPSAEMLAGSGPSMTYPAPPSANASPEAIASVAGGTATRKQTPGSESQLPPAFGSPASQIASVGNPSGTAINKAAAKANGFGGAPSSYSAPNYTSPSYPPPNYATTAPKAPSTAPSSFAAATPSGYRFGQSATTPASSTGPATSSPATYSLSSNSNLPSRNAVGRSSVGQSNGASPASSMPNSYANASPPAAFTLPSSPTSTTASPTNPVATAGGPKYSTASALPAAPSAPPSMGGSYGSTSGVSPVSGYMPGSTGATSGYPAGSYPAATPGGSFYR